MSAAIKAPHYVFCPDLLSFGPVEIQKDFMEEKKNVRS
jgi:hypothetical protein